jgi:hypothetical protein
MLLADRWFTELEALGPLETIRPEAYTEHTERWYLFDKVPLPESEGEIEKNITRRILDVTKGC